MVSVLLAGALAVGRAEQFEPPHGAWIALATV